MISIESLKKKCEFSHSREPETIRRVKIIGEKLEDPRFKEGICLDDEFFSFMRLYPMTLTDGEPLKEGNVAKALLYCLSRLPEDLFNETTDVELVLTNDHDLFMSRQKTELKTAKDRRRWYVTDHNPNSNKKTVYLQIRDQELQDSTDLIELMSFLGILSIAKRARYKQMQPITDREGLKQKFPSFSSEDNFDKWKKSQITVKIDFDESRKGAVDVLLEQLKKHPFPEAHESRLPFLLIGNDFSFRLLMFTILLGEEQVKALEKIYSDKLSSIQILFNSKQIPDNYRKFIYKYVLLTLLNKNYHQDEENRSLYDRIFSPENYQQLGYTRLVYGVRPPLNHAGNDYEKSVMAEPVDYWDPSKFNPSLLDDETDPIKRIFTMLINRKQPLLSIPYVVGNLSLELSTKLISAGLSGKNEIGFVGKVGHFVEHGKPSLNRGDIVTITSCASPGSERISMPNAIQFDDELYPLSHLVHSTVNLTAQAVTLQTYKDLKAAQSINQPLTIEMEQYLLIKGLQSISAQILCMFYVSDISREPVKKLFGGKLHNDAEKITLPLDPIEGAAAVALSTLIVVSNLDRKADY